MPDGKKTKRPLQQSEKDRAIFLHQQGVEDKEIARELGVDARQISGYLRTQINFGKIPPPPPKVSSSPELDMPLPPPAPLPPESQQPVPPPMSAAPTSPPPAPAFAPTPPPPQSSFTPPPPPPTQAPVSQDGWVGGRPIPLTAAGDENRAQQLRTVVEREGVGGVMDVVGEHFGTITREQICDIYGGGTYRIIRYEPGKAPYEYRVRAAEAAFGPPRTPRRATAVGDQSSRPGFQRPWNSWRSQQGGQGDPDENERPPAPRPFSSFSRPDPGLSDFARHGGGSDASASAATEAIKQMGRMNEQIIEQASKARETGPDSFVTQFFHQQQQIWEQKLAEESRRRDQERKDEEARRQQERKDEELRWQRRQEEADKAHQRELERIREESNARDRQQERTNKQLMELEEKRREVDRQEYKNRESSLHEELKRNRDELIATREAVATQIGESEQRFQTRFSEHQQALEREHKLKEQHLKIEEQRQNEIIALKREAIQNAGGDQLFQTINTVIKEFSKGLEKIVDLKKIEALTPEAQAAAVAKGTIDGNVLGDPKRAQQHAPEVQAGGASNAASVQAAAAAQQKKDAAGAAAAQPTAAAQGASSAGDSKTKEQEMEQIIQDMLDKPFFKQVIKEWCLHVKRGEEPSSFANMYMEWMRDPVDHEGRKATTMFANFIKPRDWTDMLKIMGPKLDADTLAVFRSEAASDYYEAFRAMVVEQIRDYWEQFMANRKAQRAAQTAAGEAPAVAPPGGEMPVEKK